MTDFISQLSHDVWVFKREILVLIRVCVDIEKKIADLNRCKSCLDALDQFPLVVECGDVHRVFKGRLSDKKQQVVTRDVFTIDNSREQITSVEAVTRRRLYPRCG